MSTKKTTYPDDKPYDFNLDAVEAEADWRPFRVHHGGKRWTLTHMQELDIWALLDEADQGDNAAMRAVFRLALGDQWDDFRALGMPQFKLQRLFKAYREHCGAPAGEGEASASS